MNKAIYQSLLIKLVGEGSSSRAFGNLLLNEVLAREIYIYIYKSYSAIIGSTNDENLVRGKSKREEIFDNNCYLIPI